MKIRTAILYNILIMGFLLGIHNGQIAIWKDEDPSPAIVLPYKADTLPFRERMMLKKGIRFDTLADLEKAVLDYLQ